MIDVLLVNPRETGGFFERMPPLGLAYIAANLEKHGHSVRVVDFDVDNTPLTKWLEKLQPQFLGISGTTHTRFESFRLAQEAKEYNREIITIYGGVHATFTSVDTLQTVRAIDFVVRGEGEQTMVSLINAARHRHPLATVPGIAYRDGDEVRETEPAERIQDLDSLPKPAFHLLNMEEYALNMEFVNKKGISLITSRGCQARCVFCSASRMFDYRVTTHSAARVLDELEFLLDTYGFQGVKIFDSTFTMKRDHVSAFCAEVMRRQRAFPWECEIRVGTVDEPLLTQMRDAGCYYVNFGIESASEKVLNTMGKGFTVKQAHALIELCKKVGVKTKIFFSYGHIGETMDDVQQTFDFIARHENNITTVASGAGIRIYPGTYLEEYARMHGLLPANFRWSLPYDEPRLAGILQARSVPLLIQPQLGYAELEEIALRIYSKRFAGWTGIRRGMRKVTDPEKLKKLMQLVKTGIKCRYFARGCR